MTERDMSEEKKRTFIVYCSYPSGLKLRLFHMMEARKTEEPPRSVASGETVTLEYGFNSGVDAEFWEAWAEQNKGTDAAGYLKAEEEK